MKKIKNFVVVCKSKKKGVDILKNTEIHTIKNLNYKAKLVKVASNYFIFVSSKNTSEENKFILYYTIEYFSKNQKDTIINFKLNRKNFNIYLKVFKLLKKKKFDSEILNKLVKLVGDLNEK